MGHVLGWAAQPLLTLGIVSKQSLESTSRQVDVSAPGLICYLSMYKTVTRLPLK